MYSHSRINTYETCPLQFRLRYIDKATPLFENTVEAFLGSLVHDTLEKLYKDLSFERLNSLQELLDYFNSKWNEKWDDSIRIVKDYSPEDYRKVGERCITEYYEAYKPFNHERHIECEKRIVIQLGDYKLQGYIDRLSCDDDGTYYVHDYKTSATLPTQEYIEKDRQLALYSIAVKEHYQDCSRVKLKWHYLAFNKEITHEWSEEEIERLKQDTESRIREIEAAKEYPASPSSLCGWCQYQHLCPHFMHQYMQDGKEDGAELVEKYAALKRKEKKISEELENVKNAIISYAEKNNLMAVYGVSNKARVWQKECLKFPGKNDPSILEIRDFLERVGKFSEISIVDTWELAKIVEDGRWPDYITTVLKQFARKEKVQRIYLSDFNR